MTLARKGDKGGSGTRRGGGFRSSAKLARENIRAAAAGHGFAEPEVLLRWPEIVGERLAGLCEPVKVAYPRSHELGATLLVRAEGARAPEVEHLGPRIVERVNQYYGYRAVSRLKVTQAAVAGGLAEQPAPFEGPVREPTAAAAAEAAEMARDIENEALRAAVAQMGAYVLTRSRT